MSLNTDIGRLVDRGMNMDVHDEDYTLLSANGPLYNDELLVRIEHEDGSITIEILPGDVDVTPLVVKFNRWDDAILDLVERWVG